MGCIFSKKENNNNNKNKSTESSSVVDPEKVNKGNIRDFYDIGEEIGRGTFSIVKVGIHKETQKKVALKFIDKKFVDKDDLILLRREIDIMKRVKHENVTF